MRSYDARRAQHDAARRTEQIARMFKLSGAPERHRAQSKSGLIAHRGWTEAAAKVWRVIAGGGMAALIGSPGSGKTQIGVEVIKRDLLAHARPVRYEVLADLFAIVREAYGAAATKSEMAVLREFTAPHLLVIDEIDKRGGTDAEQRLLHRILDKRYRQMLPTLLIGNVEDADALQTLLDGFAGDGIGPLFDRLRQTGGIVQAFGWNFRDGSAVAGDGIAGGAGAGGAGGV